MSLPIESILPPANMNIASPATYDILQNNSNAIDQYANAALSGKTNVYSKDKSQSTKPFGQRYFLDTNMPCEKFQESGNTNRFILVDNKKYRKFNGSTDTNNFGLLYSAEGSLQEIESNSLVTNDNMNFNPAANINKCVPVTIVTDDSNNTDTKYVTIKDCKKIDPIAFSGGRSTCPNIENFHGMNEGDGIVKQRKMVKDITYGPAEYDNTEEDEVNYVSLSNEDYRVQIDDDTITRIYFSSIVVVGLFILYRFFDKAR